VLRTAFVILKELLGIELANVSFGLREQILESPSMTAETERNAAPASPPLVSIVTPVYNEEEHLAECIESVLSQTYKNWDYVIVDNCSTDGSLEIARRYAAKDRRIRIWQNQRFLHAVSNHNGALRQVSPASKYCKVVFADDWIFPECLERMVAIAEKYPSIGIVSAYGLHGSHVAWTGLPYPSSFVSGREICRQLFLQGLYVFGTPTSVLYRADLVRKNDPFYNERNIMHGDMEACVALLKTCDFGFVHQILTFTRLRPGCRIALSEDLETFIVGKLHDLATHGPDYLTREEFESCLDSRLSEYYHVLASNLVRRRPKEFWDYHKRELAEAGVGFDRARLAVATLSKLFNALLNPKSTVKDLLIWGQCLAGHHKSPRSV
jgi:glycosyltransferase involved in cell wall biosynthesis